MSMFREYIIGWKTVSRAVDENLRSMGVLTEKSQMGTLRKPKASCIHSY